MGSGVEHRSPGWVASVFSVELPPALSLWFYVLLLVASYMQGSTGAWQLLRGPLIGPCYREGNNVTGSPWWRTYWKVQKEHLCSQSPLWAPPLGTPGTKLEGGCTQGQAFPGKAAE